MLSELATCLYALTATRDNGLWAPQRRQFLSKALPDVPIQRWWAACRDKRLLPEPKLGKRVGLVAGQSRNVQECLG